MFILFSIVNIIPFVVLESYECNGYHPLM